MNGWTRWWYREKNGEWHWVDSILNLYQCALYDDVVLLPHPPVRGRRKKRT